MMNRSEQFLQKLNDHMDTGVDAENQLLRHQGRLDALKFIDEQAAVKSTAVRVYDQQQNAY